MLTLPSAFPSIIVAFAPLFFNGFDRVLTGTPQAVYRAGSEVRAAVKKEWFENPFNSVPRDGDKLKVNDNELTMN